LKRPENGISPSGENYSYSPNDMSCGDLDGDGKWDLILKWAPTNSHDNAHKGYTGNVYLDGYKLDGTFLWRIDLEVNIRSGAHYNQFLVADYDGDGKAEIACKTTPGTKDGFGNFLNTGPAANDNDTINYRNKDGFIVEGPEYLTIFNGETGKEMATVNYIPQRGNQMDWGDDHGNRVDRFLATNAYLDGNKPSMVFQRGYYTRMALTAYDWDGKTLLQRWAFDSNDKDSEKAFNQGNHNISAGDIDSDGFDEIVEGACAIDQDGKLMYSTGLGHGDAMHLGDLDLDNPGLEVFTVHENHSAKYGYDLHDAKTGNILWGGFTGTDNGRGIAADIDASSPGYEMWSKEAEGIFSSKGKQLSKIKPSVNFRIYWDGDLQDELLDGTVIEKWNGNGTDTLINFNKFSNASKINGTKANPCLQADLSGDWREEVIYYNSATNDELLIFTTTILTNHRLYTLMHDPIYRLGVAWQNVAYNQPPHLGFFLGNGTEKAPKPNIVLIKK
jgi:rhamnogalacturonan endolyase